MGKVPTISINKTDGCHVYLSEASLSCEIVSAKSSEMNVLVPKDGEFVSVCTGDGGDGGICIILTTLLLASDATLLIML